eukprot:scaffold15196_cov121-Isochrysis_galbana.AAC.2
MPPHRAAHHPETPHQPSSRCSRSLEGHADQPQPFPPRPRIRGPRLAGRWSHRLWYDFGPSMSRKQPPAIRPTLRAPCSVFIFIYFYIALSPWRPSARPLPMEA